jgi:hypothetical protein
MRMFTGPVFVVRGASSTHSMIWVSEIRHLRFWSWRNNPNPEHEAHGSEVLGQPNCHFQGPVAWSINPPDR